MEADASRLAAFMAQRNQFQPLRLGVTMDKIEAIDHAIAMVGQVKRMLLEQLQIIESELKLLEAKKQKAKEESKQ